MARSSRPLTPEVLQEEVRFLLKTLLRDDLFGEQVSLTEAEKLLESSLSVGFVEYCAFLKRHAYVDVDRGRNTIAVLPRGKHLSDGGADPQLIPMIAAHFAKAIDSARPPGAPGAPSAGAEQPQARIIVAAQPQVSMGAPPVHTVVVDRLEPERFLRADSLGQGSLGDVVKAKDSVLERDVVMKELRQVFALVTYLPREEIVRRVREAVMAQAKLDHPHVLRVVDVNFGGEPVIVLEHAAGGSLRARMQKGLLPVDVVLRIILQASTALSFAHTHGVVHGGLKPENVLFDAAGNVRLSDFGISRATERVPDANTSAPPVYVGRGNTSYMAPEHLHKGELSPAGDIYALGILLYELLCGTLPGRRSPMPGASKRVAEKLGDTAKALDDLFDRMTRDPLEERFKNFDDVLTALYSILPKKNVVGRGTLLLYEKDWAEMRADNPFATAPHTGLESLPSAEGEEIETTNASKHTVVTSEA